VLTQEGYLKSVRGAQGGYLLARSADEITAGNIMRASEGGFLSMACLDSDSHGCPRQLLCETTRFWGGLRNAIDDYVDGVTISQLAGV